MIEIEEWVAGAVPQCSWTNCERETGSSRLCEAHRELREARLGELYRVRYPAGTTTGRWSCTAEATHPAEYPHRDAPYRNRSYQGWCGPCLADYLGCDQATAEALMLERRAL